MSGKPTALAITVTGNGVINSSKHRLDDKELRRYEKLTQETLKERIEQYIHKIQKANVDPVGFGLRFQAKSWSNNSKWDIWKEAYPTIKTLIKVKLKLNNTELIQ